MGGGGTPHVPAVIGRVPGFKGHQFPADSPGDAPSGGDRRRKHDAAPDMDFPEFLTSGLGQTVDVAGVGADEDLATSQ